MTQRTDKIFVYGTLLRGEPRSAYMQDCELMGAFGVPGKLYDTGRGYPAALFDHDTDDTVYGELYLVEDAGRKISELDRVEGTESGLFRRVGISYNGDKFFSYEAGSLLTESITEENRIRSGSWRKSSSLAFEDPVNFALNFETHLKKSYREPVDKVGNGTIFLRGKTPVLVTAPHATAHVRMNKLKRQEFYTGALSVMLHSVTGCHALYTNRQSGIDPNYYDDSPFKAVLADVACRHDIRLIIDVHGTGPERESDVYPGIGKSKEFLLGNDSYLSGLERAAESCGVSLGGLDVFPAARQMTVTKFSARNLGIPAFQLEINRRLRQPDTDPSGFTKLARFLREFIESAR